MIRTLLHRKLIQFIVSEELTTLRTWISPAIQLSHENDAPLMMIKAPLQFTHLRNFSSTTISQNNKDEDDDNSNNTKKEEPPSESPPSQHSSNDILKNTKLWRQWVEGRLEDTSTTPQSTLHTGHASVRPGSLPSGYGSPVSSPHLRPRDRNQSNAPSDWKRAARTERATQNRIENILSSDRQSPDDPPSGRYGVLGSAHDAPKHVPGAAARAEEISPRRISPHRLFYPGATYSPQDLNPYKAKEVTIRSDLMVNRGSIPTRQVEAMADFRNSAFLSNFITETGRLFPRRKTRLPAKLQRELARQVKLARAMAIMNPTAKVLHHGSGGGGGGGGSRQAGGGFMRRQQKQS